MSDFDELVHNDAGWLSSEGDEGEIILSSRARIARNLSGHRFTHHCDAEDLAEILGKSWEAARHTGVFQQNRFIQMGQISTLDRQFLAERHLVSLEFVQNSANRALVVNRGEDTSLMINEEDHLRIQGFAAGFDVETAWRRADVLDTELSRLELAHSERFGYLTACPTNLGTGLRVSVLIHLPGMVHSKEINKLLDSLRKLNYSIRGLYGEGSEVMGNFFQLSNSATLGKSEQDIVAGLREMVVKVIGFERRAREMLFRKARRLLEDKVWRAYGLLRYARSVNTKEALSLVSAVRLGVGAGLIDGLSIRSLNELLVYTQPAHLQKVNDRKMDASERDVARADYIRQALSAGPPA